MNHPQPQFLNKATSAWLIGLFCMLVGGLSNASTLTANVDRTAISENETLTLTVQYKGDRVNSDPDFSDLTQQFDILHNQKSMQHSVVNGQINSSTEWTLTLAPKNAGQLLIPPFSLNNTRSRPINIAVNSAANSTKPGQQEVFLETEIDQNEGYVQEQFIVTYRLYYNRRVDNLDMPELSADNTRIESLPRVDYQKTIGHTTYGVSEFRYALFPDASGSIRLDRQTWTVRTTDQASNNRFGFGGGRYKLHRVKTEQIEITVLPQPSEYPNNQYWLPAQELTLSQQWSRNPDEFKLGEPITRTVTINAVGASAEQLPELFADISHPDFKFYPDKPIQDSQLKSQGVVGSRTESIAIVPTKAGPLILPEVSVSWWNSAKNELETTTLPAIEINVAASTNLTNTSPEPAATLPPVLPNKETPQPAAEHTSTWFWPFLSALLLICNVIFCWLWLQLRVKQKRAQQRGHADQGGSPQGRTAPALVQIKQACRARSALQLNQALLAWVQAHYPQHPTALSTLLTQTEAPNLQQHIHKLEAHLYKDDSIKVDYEAIEKTMDKLHTPTRNSGARETDIPALYPST